MSSLKGKPIEALARLGGHSFLTLPSGFAPITLKLPVCFAATAHYVAVHGKSLHQVGINFKLERLIIIRFRTYDAAYLSRLWG